MFPSKKYKCKTEATMAISNGMFRVSFHHYTTHLRRPSLRSFLDAWHAGPSSVSTRTPPFSQPAQDLAPAVFWELLPRLIHYPINPVTHQLTAQTTRKRGTRWTGFSRFFCLQPKPNLCKVFGWGGIRCRMACGRTTRTVRVDPPPGEPGSRDNDKLAKGLGVFSGQLCLYSHGHDISMQA